jgi:hypothetical protein
VVAALLLIVVSLGGATLAQAVDVAGVAEQVSVDSYTDFLQNELYAHDGDSREFGGQHNLARQNIQERFESFGLYTRLDPFLYSGAEYYNVVAVLPGVVRPREIYLVGAHYDSVAGSPGASDNAASVASVVEAARVLSRGAGAGRQHGLCEQARTGRYSCHDRPGRHRLPSLRARRPGV